MGPDLTLINLNMLYLRLLGAVEHEPHVPLGCLYLIRALEDRGFDVDFRDYQFHAGNGDPFDLKAFARFCASTAPIIGLSCMANLLPFAILAARELRRQYPNCTLIFGGVGPKGVEESLLERFKWIDIIYRGEGEIGAPLLLQALKERQSLDRVPNITYRKGGVIVSNPECARVRDLDSLPFPAYEKTRLDSYQAHGLIASRGCPYPCEFCSVMPFWNRVSTVRSPKNVVREMRWLHDRHGADYFLFQDEYFLSSKSWMLAFCRALKAARLGVRWKSYGRVNLVDRQVMEAMADAGCVQLRFGIESGSDRVLNMIRKGFTAAQATKMVGLAGRIFPEVETFFIWGFPFETAEDFHQTLFQMIGFRLLGVRVLPSLLSFLPQTTLYQRHRANLQLEFRPDLIPEIVLTGHEVVLGDGRAKPVRQQRQIFDLIRQHPDIFPGFLHHDAKNNILPKLELLKKHGFYRGYREISHD